MLTIVGVVVYPLPRLRVERRMAGVSLSAHPPFDRSENERCF